MDKIVKAIKGEFEKLGLSQAEFSRRHGVPQGMISRWLGDAEPDGGMNSRSAAMMMKLLGIELRTKSRRRVRRKSPVPAPYRAPGAA